MGVLSVDDPSFAGVRGGKGAVGCGGRGGHYYI